MLWRPWRIGREWQLPDPTFEGEDTIDTEDGLPIVTEDTEHELLTEGT